MNSKSYYIAVLLSSIYWLSSCDNTVKKEDAVARAPEAVVWDIPKTKQVRRSIEYAAAAVPVGFYLDKFLPKASPRQKDSIARSLSDQRVVVAEFRHLNGDDLLEKKYTNRAYEDAVKYMAFTIKNDYSAVTTAQDTIPCSGVLFERNFNVAPFKRVLLYFSGVPQEEDVQLLYNDQLFGNGQFSFDLNKKFIKS